MEFDCNVRYGECVALFWWENDLVSMFQLQILIGYFPWLTIYFTKHIASNNNGYTKWKHLVSLLLRYSRYVVWIVYVIRGSILLVDLSMNTHKGFQFANIYVGPQNRWNIDGFPNLILCYSQDFCNKSLSNNQMGRGFRTWRHLGSCPRCGFWPFG